MAVVGPLLVLLVSCSGRTVIKSARVLMPDMTVKPAELVVCGSLIQSVNEPGGALSDVDGEEDVVFDVGDRLVTPAFINAHTHLPMAALRGVEGCASAMSGDVVVDLYFKLEEKMSEEDVRAFTRMGAYESLLSGVGLVWEHYYHGKGIAAALVDTGLAGVVAPTLQDLAGPGVPLLEQAMACTADLSQDASMRAHGVFAAFGPHATDTVGEGLWRRIVDEAQGLGGIPVHFHVGQSIAEFEAVHSRTGGRTPLGHLKQLGVLDSDLPLLLVHAQYATAADIELLRPERHVLCSCPYSHALFAFPSPVLRWHAAGIPIAVGTDAAASNDCMNVQKELRLLGGFGSFTATFSRELDDFWGLDGHGTHHDDIDEYALVAARALHEQRQLAHLAEEAQALRDPAELLQTVWATPGTMHPHFSAGVLQSGSLANLLIWDTSHPKLWPSADPLSALVMCDATPAISAMMVAGRWIGSDPSDSSDFRTGLLRSSAYASAREEADERLRALLKAVDLSPLPMPEPRGRT